MSANKKPSKLAEFLNSKKHYPVITALGAGLYPIFFYYSNNYSLINTWKHLGFFIILFILVPILLFSVVNRLTKTNFLKKLEPYALPFLNVFAFLFYIELCLYAGVQLGWTLAALAVALLFSWFLHKQLKKLVVIQLLLAVIVQFSLIPTIIGQLNYSTEWMTQPDDIETAVFSKKPNVYYIQTDGYVNISEFGKGHYQGIDNSAYWAYLEGNDFTIYEDIRSNYHSTLVSNSCTFVMKHHYYNGGFNFSESLDARNVIITDNPVLRIFRKNGYKTHYISEGTYLLASKPKMGYDVSNFDTENVGYIGTGYEQTQDIVEALDTHVKNEADNPKFFFVQVFTPGHVATNEAKSKGAEGERQKWITSLDRTNRVVKKLVDRINENDPDALILIMADHGGFIGLDYTKQMQSKKVLDRDMLYSIFSINLAIKWPKEVVPKFDTNFRSSVNVFRILFAELAGNAEYLDNLQDDSSFLRLTKDTPKGTYECINGEGKVTIKKRNER